MRKKIWAGVGLVAAAGTLAAAAPGLAADSTEAGKGRAVAGIEQPILLADASTGASAGGEGGEGGESGGSASKDPLADFAGDAIKLGGHLIVADELVALDRWDEALPHVEHPSKELYSEMTAGMKQFGVPAFDAALATLTKATAAKDKAGYAAARQAMAKVLDGIDATVKTKAGDRWVAVAMQAAMAALREGADDYGKALDPKDPSKIADAAEYQDSRGYVWRAAQVIDALAADPTLAATPAMARTLAQTLAKTKNKLDELKLAWPSVLPPAKTTRDLASVNGDVSAIEFSTSSLTR